MVTFSYSICSPPQAKSFTTADLPEPFLEEDEQAKEEDERREGNFYITKDGVYCQPIEETEL